MSLMAYCKKLRKKAIQRTALLSKLRGHGWGASPKVLLSLYKSYIRPILEYGSVLTAEYCCPSGIAHLQKVQNRAIRIALRLPRHTKISTLHRMAKMDTIIDRLQMLRSKALKRYDGSILMQELEIEQTFLNLR